MIVKRLFMLYDIYRPTLNKINEYLQPQFNLRYRNYNELILELNGTYLYTVETIKNEKWRHFINGVSTFVLSLDNSLLKNEEKVDHFIFYKNYISGFESQARNFCIEQLKPKCSVEIERHDIIYKEDSSEEEILICDAGYRDAVEGQVAFDLFIPKKSIREKSKKIQVVSSNNTLTLKISVKDLVSEKSNKFLKSGIKFNYESMTLFNKETGNNINLKYIFTCKDELEIDVPVYYLNDKTILELTT